MILEEYKYFAKPDGEDPLGKILSCMRYTLYTGAFMGLNDVFTVTQCQTIKHSLVRIGFWMIPINSIGFAFPTVTYISTRLRGKDDSINHAIGALSIVPILRAWWNIPFSLSFQIASALVVVAVFNKGLSKDSPEIILKPNNLPQHT